MRAYAKEYVSDVVENQGKLFDLVAQKYPDKDTAAFINSYMASKTRKSIDEAKAYVNTMSAPELWDYFCKTEDFYAEGRQSHRGVYAGLDRRILCVLSMVL